MRTIRVYMMSNLRNITTEMQKSAIRKMAEELSTSGEHLIYNRVGQQKVMGIWTESLESGDQIDVIYKCKLFNMVIINRRRID